jgi:hydroxyacylglutathione hydrolase
MLKTTGVATPLKRYRSMAVEVKRLILGIVQTACYVVGDTESHLAIVIDPADEAGRILEAARSADWKIEKILATHAHFDHVLAAAALQKATGAPFLMHRDDLPVLQSMALQGELFGLRLPSPPQPDGYVAEGGVISAGAIELQVLFTPGHSPGHVSYVLREAKIVFSGDCLFAGSIGRTDLPGGDMDTLLNSIRDKLLALGDDFTVAPGHPPPTTIGQERRSNPFIGGE